MSVLRLLTFAAALLIPVSASAVTVHDIIELARAGLPDDVLVAVIDADRTVFALDKQQILELKAAGVSKAVLLKMIRSRREFEAPPEAVPVTTDAQPVQPELTVVEQPAPVTVVVPQYVVPQYYYVPYSIWGVPTRHAPRTPPPPVMQHRGFGRFINDGWVDRR